FLAACLASPSLGYLPHGAHVPRHLLVHPDDGRGAARYPHDPPIPPPEIPLGLKGRQAFHRRKHLAQELSAFVGLAGQPRESLLDVPLLEPEEIEKGPVVSDDTGI